MFKSGIEPWLSFAFSKRTNGIMKKFKENANTWARTRNAEASLHNLNRWAVNLYCVKVVQQLVYIQKTRYLVYIPVKNFRRRLFI